MRYFFKAFVFLGICVATWMLLHRTNPVSGSPPEKKSDLRPFLKFSEFRSSAKNSKIENLDGFEPGKIFMSMNPLKITVTDGQALVIANPKILDDRASSRFIWRLTILDVNNKIISSYVYGDQVFTAQPTGEIHPTFEELVTLPEGARHIALGIYRFQDEVDLKVFDDESEARKHQATKSFTTLKY